MVKTIQKILPVFLVVMLLVSWIPYQPAAAASEAYYGEAYNDLPSEEMRLAYQLVEEGIAGLAPVIDFQGIVNIGYWDLADVLRAVVVDHPEYFWFLETGTCHYDELTPGDFGDVISFEPEYILDGRTVKAGSQELADAMYAFHTKVRQIIDGIPANYATDYEIAVYLYDYLAQNVTYTLEGEHPSAYAALIRGEAACYGYSKAYQCLLNAAGIRARTITGDSPDGNGKLIGHAWNQVWLDGKCYYMDVTWDDFEEVILHACFAMSLEEISKEHFADEEFILPECDHDSMRYHSFFHGKGVAIWNGYTSASEAAGCFRPVGIGENGAEFHCEVQYTDGGFVNWFGWHLDEICDQMGLSRNTEAYYYTMYDVYYLILIDPSYSADPAVTAIMLDEQTVTLTGPGTRYHLQPHIQAESQWTPNLIYTTSDPAVATVDENGMITSVGEGTAVITASSPDGSVKADCTVFVEAAPAHVHTMRRFEMEESTCTQDGHEAYYLCTECGCRFGDENGAVKYSQTSEYVIPATHKRLFLISQSGYHIQQCKCGAKLPETKEAHVDSDGDGICEICNLSVDTIDLKDPGLNQNTQKDSTFRDVVVPIAIGIVGVLVAAILFVLIRRRIRGY